MSRVAIAQRFVPVPSSAARRTAGPIESPNGILRRTIWLFLAFAAYLAAPLGDVPLLGLSLSAPLLMLVAVEVLVGKQAVDLRPHEKWVLWAAIFWTGSFASLAGSVFQGRITDLDVRDLQTLLRFAFWMVVFVVTAIISSRVEVAARVGSVLAVAVVALSAVRLLSGTRVLTQNSFGLQFSTFTPYAVALVLIHSGRRKGCALIGLTLLLAAAAVNLSRGSWVAEATGLSVFALLTAMSRPRLLLRLWPLAFLPVAAVAALAWSPEFVVEPIEKRWSSFERLEQDKSYQIRLLMNQKGERLFLENPLFGAGAGRFTRTSVSLDLPPALRYARQGHFDIKSAHNSYIALLGETGLAGTVPFAILVGILAAGGLWAALRQAKRGELWTLASYVSFVGMSVHFWVISALTDTSPWFVYGLLAGGITREVQYALRRRPA